MFFGEVNEQLFIFEVDWGDSVVSVLLMALLLEVGEETPTKKAN